MLMNGKIGVIMGIANNLSIAYGIAKKIVEQGGKVILTYQGEALKKRIMPISEELNAELVLECNVANSQSIDEIANLIKEKYGKIDFLVHSIGYSDKNELRGRYVDTSKENFLNTLDISCFSFTSVLKHFDNILNDNSSAITLTYYGAEKYMPHYNVMGVAKAALEASLKYLAVDFGTRNIRVNGISAGPLKTLAASGIGDFRKIFQWNEENTPLRRNTSIEEVAGTGVYLLSSLSEGVTGEIVHVDSGYHVMGMKMVNKDS